MDPNLTRAYHSRLTMDESAIDIDLMYIEDRTKKFFHLATGKTLDSDGEAFLRMSRIAAECSILLNGRGCLVRLPESSYPNKENTHIVSVPLADRLDNASLRTSGSAEQGRSEKQGPEL